MCFFFISNSKGHQITKNILQKKKVGKPTFFCSKTVAIKNTVVTAQRGMRKAVGQKSQSEINPDIGCQWTRCQQCSSGQRPAYLQKNICGPYPTSKSCVKVKSIKFRRNRESMFMTKTQWFPRCDTKKLNDNTDKIETNLIKIKNI